MQLELRFSELRESGRGPTYEHVISTHPTGKDKRTKIRTLFKRTDTSITGTTRDWTIKNLSIRSKIEHRA